MKIQSLDIQRSYFIDYFRAFIICLVIFDHSLHAYSASYGKFWFLPDFDRDQFFDIFHLHNDSFMMPSLFFISGLFILPSLNRRGYLNFIKERILKLGIPFVLGIIFICPLLSYPKYKEYTDPFINFSDYIFSIYFLKPQAGPFWFLYYLGLLSALALILKRFYPKFPEILTQYCQWILKNPLLGSGSIFLISAFIMGISDLIWGAPWWIGFGKFFYVRSSRFILKGWFFFLGIGFSQCEDFQTQKIWNQLKSYGGRLCLFTIIVGIAYIFYSLKYFEQGAYNDEVRFYFKQGGDWGQSWPIIKEFAPKILIRTTLLSLFILTQLVAYLCIFYRFLNYPSPFWLSLSSASYGIYIIHEPFVVWIQWYFHGKDVLNIFKFLAVSFISLLASWIIVKYGLLRIKILKRIL